MSDRLLVEKILAGDTRLFSLIVDDTERLVAQIVRKLVDDDQDQQDLAQDIYLKVYQKLSTFRFQAKLSTWIAQIAYHTCCTHLEKKKVPLDRLGLEHEHELTQLNDTPAEQFAPETQALMLAELEKLPPLYKMLISLYHLEELSNREISVITNLPEGTIKSYLFRARKQLKERLNASHKKYRL